MEEEKISRTQLMALLWAGVMAPAAELLPALLLSGAGKGAWLAVVLAAPLVLAAGWIMGSLAGQDGLARSITGGLGKWAGGAALLLYIVWGLLLLALRLRLCAQRLLNSGERDGALWFFLLAAAAVLLWIGRGKLAAFARAGQLFLAALLVTAGTVLLLSLVQAKPERLLPLWWQPAGPVLQAALSAAGVMGWGLFLPFLMGNVRDQGEKKNWHWLFWGLGGAPAGGGGGHRPVDLCRPDYGRYPDLRGPGNGGRVPARESAALGPLGSGCAGYGGGAAAVSRSGRCGNLEPAVGPCGQFDFGRPPASAAAGSGKAASKKGEIRHILWVRSDSDRRY